jgi:UDP-3-O-acyl-N-acetylglucosamine deacetylase
MTLLGHPLIGHVEAHRAGHALHTAAAAKLLEDRDAWMIVTHPQLPVWNVRPPSADLAFDPASS